MAESQWRAWFRTPRTPWTPDPAVTLVFVSLGTTPCIAMESTKHCKHCGGWQSKKPHSFCAIRGGDVCCRAGQVLGHDGVFLVTGRLAWAQTRASRHLAALCQLGPGFVPCTGIVC